MFFKSYTIYEFIIIITNTTYHIDFSNKNLYLYKKYKQKYKLEKKITKIKTKT